MAGAALWLPHDWDWGVWDWLSSQHAPVFDSHEISIVDVPWQDGKDQERRRIATFLQTLLAHKQKPDAVILDVEFTPCDTRTCEGSMASARRELISAIRASTESFSVYALEQPTRTSDDEATGLDPHDPDIYAALSGAAHTTFTARANPATMFYRACYNVPIVDANSNVVAVQPVWDMVERVALRPGQLSSSVCDTNHVAVRLPADPVSPAQAAITSLNSQGVPPTAAQFTGKFVIVGTIQADRPADTPLRGPELVAWALSNALQPGSGPNAELKYDTEPQGAMLLVLVPAFSAISITAYTAIFFLLKGTRLRTLRVALPWMTAVLAAVFGIAIFAAFEAWLLVKGHIQPQVTLIALGVLLACALASLRAFQYLFDQTWTIDAPVEETYDYDVFISYAHEEGAWVYEHVYAPLRDARLPDRNLSVFFDTDSIRYGTAWQDKITLAIDGSRFVVPVYSDIYFNHPYCRFEIMRAQLKWIKAGVESRCVLPVMRGTPKIPATVADIQASSIDVVPDLVDQIVAEIVGRLSRPDVSAKAATPYVAPAT